MLDGMSDPQIALTHEPIDYHALTESVRTNSAGGVLLFLGTVREMTQGRRTLALDYDAYPEMALATMRQVVDEAKEQWPIEQAAVVHRLGQLEIGEISIALAVSCGHRAETFAAGRYLIDRLKEIVPIWKKENWDDGTTEWVHPGTGDSVVPPQGDSGV